MKKSSQLAAILLCAGALLNSAWGGEIKGRVVVSRILTKKRVTVPNYQARGPATAPPVSNISAADEFNRIAIYLETTTSMPVTPVAASLGQKSQRFEPGLVIIPAGSTVSFPNRDPIFHNVFSLSPGKQFDLGYYPAAESREVKFDQPGIVQVFCHLHPDMNAAIVVVPTPWYGRPDAQGAFSFKDLPAGSYTVIVWHRSAGYFRRRVELTDQGTIDIPFEIPLQEISRR